MKTTLSRPSRSSSASARTLSDFGCQPMRRATTCSGRSSMPAFCANTASTSAGSLRLARHTSRPASTCATSQACSARCDGVTSTPCGPCSAQTPRHSVLSQSTTITLIGGSTRPATVRASALASAA